MGSAHRCAALGAISADYHVKRSARYHTHSYRVTNHRTTHRRISAGGEYPNTRKAEPRTWAPNSKSLFDIYIQFPSCYMLVGLSTFSL